MKFDHLTAVVTDADAAASMLQRLLDAEPVASVNLPGMAIRSFRFGDGEIHLNAPTGPGPVQDHHQRHGPGFHHIALRVSDLSATLATLAARGFAPLGRPIETAPGLREVFLDPAGTEGLMIQLVERRNVPTESYELDPDAVTNLAAQTSERR